MVSESAGADPGRGHFLPQDEESNLPHPDNRIAVDVGGPDVHFALDLGRDGSLVWCSDDLRRRFPDFQSDAAFKATLSDLARGARFLQEDPEAVLTRPVTLGDEPWQAQQTRKGDRVRVELLPPASSEPEAAALAQVEARRAALQSMQLESGFLLRRSHALRTPMNAVVGMASLLDRSGLDDEQRELVEIIRSSSKVLLSVIDDILDFSRVEAGTLEAEPSAFDLRSTLEASVRLFELHAEQKGLDLRVEVRADIPDRLVGDHRRLRQILINLVDNALRFTDEGEIELRVERLDAPNEGSLEEEKTAGVARNGAKTGDATGTGTDETSGSLSSSTAVTTSNSVSTLDSTSVRLRFTVRDTGVGIEADRLPRVFDSFFQVDERDRYRFGGAGLGLVISSRLAELFGSGLQVRSEVGEGSSFHFDAAFARDEAPSPATTAEASATSRRGRTLRILVADDNPVNSLLATRMLEGRAHEVVNANNGREAFRAVAEGDFDLVLMDVQMPVMDGIEATKAIRRMEQDSGRAAIPIIALTAEALELAHARCMDAGMNACMAKPIDAAALFETVEGIAADPSSLPA